MFQPVHMVEVHWGVSTSAFWTYLPMTSGLGQCGMWGSGTLGTVESMKQKKNLGVQCSVGGWHCFSSLESRDWKW